MLPCLGAVLNTPCNELATSSESVQIITGAAADAFARVGCLSCNHMRVGGKLPESSGIGFKNVRGLDMS